MQSHSHSHSSSIPNPYLPFPTPATPSTLSSSQNQPPPFHFNQSTSTSATGRHASTGSSRDNNMEYSDSDQSDGEEDKVEKDKLEIRREKNRVKQRNLRLRRANHIADLERNLSTARADHAALQNAYATIQQHEANLQGWIHDLESALFRNGLASDVEALRRIWTDRESKLQRQSQSRQSSMSHQHPPQHQHQHAAGGDSLSTLARAASSIPGPSSGDSRMIYNNSRPTLPRPSSFSSRPFENPYPTPEIAWGSQMHEYLHAPDLEKKRKRESDYGPPPNYPTHRPTAHPMAGRMSESNIHTLPPIQPFSHSSHTSPAVRPLSAPHSQPQPALTTTTSGSGASTPGHNVSPRSIRISDLLSPHPRQSEPLPRSASTDMLTSARQDLVDEVNEREGWSGLREDKEGEISPKRFAEVSETGTKLPPMRFYKVDGGGGGDQKLRSEFGDREREISPKTRLSPPPSRGNDDLPMKLEPVPETRARA
ncbi:hypothetical protein CI109_106269 [Kwoniella shandongensis]|uniref:Uncharacterized protein n=1 Tax=Kwoniella shandongensis TaxID=1734106 RepID=A0A5M6C069_9TREE|nr:uncharacterized protein CI109_003872 [Kwoniella shandongensis]KAA5527900.1 hypothetical protein CI109_003872 [Kwoniella shandongensis]